MYLADRKNFFLRKRLFYELNAEEERSCYLSIQKAGTPPSETQGLYYSFKHNLLNKVRLERTSSSHESN